MQDEVKSYNTARWLAYALEDLAAAQYVTAQPRTTAH